MNLASNSIIINATPDVEVRLAQHFNASRKELIEVALKAAGARRESTINDPVNAPGTLSYIMGTRAIREVFRRKKWRNGRYKGIESVINENQTVQIIFQNVDLATVANYTPQAISGKQTASEELINEAQGNLFMRSGVSPEVWYFCVSCDEVSGVRAELSRPRPIVGGNFLGFHERIFIAKKGDLESASYSSDEGVTEQDYGISVSRK